MEFVPVGEDCRVVLHESRDVGGEHFRDLVEFPPLADSGEEDFGGHIAVVSEARNALDAAHAGAGAVIDRRVNQAIAGDEYLDYMRAGRPGALPGWD